MDRAAVSVCSGLGHSMLRQGRDFECFKCVRSARLDPGASAADPWTLTGDAAIERCTG